jgi:hypothetical protein
MAGRPCHRATDWNQHRQGIRFTSICEVRAGRQPVALHLLGRTVIVDKLTMPSRQQSPWVAATPRPVKSSRPTARFAGPLRRRWPVVATVELEAISLQIAEVDQPIESLTAELSQAKALKTDRRAAKHDQSNTSKVELSSQAPGSRTASRARTAARTRTRAAGPARPGRQAEDRGDDLADQRQLEAEQVERQQPSPT